MTIRVLFQIGLAFLVVALALMAVALVLVKGLRQLRDARHARLVADVRPLVLEAIDDDTAVASVFKGRRRSVAESIAIALLPKLRGADRDALTRMLTAGGVIARALGALESASATRRERGSELLGAAGVVSSSDQLIDLLWDRDAGVRIAAARALGRIGAGVAVAPLLATLGDRRVPGNTVSMAILRIGVDGAQPLIDALESPVARTRAVAAELLGTFGVSDARDRLTLMLDDPDLTVRVSAVGALGRLGMSSTASVLIDLLDLELGRPRGAQHSELTVALAGALGTIGHRSAVPILMESLDGSHRLSFAAASALASIGARPAFGPPRAPGVRGRAKPSPMSEILAGRAPRGERGAAPRISWSSLDKIISSARPGVPPVPALADGVPIARYAEPRLQSAAS